MALRIPGSAVFIVPMLLLTACGGTSAGNQGGAGGAGGGDGEGGGVGMLPGSARPACADPGEPTGPTPQARADTAGVLGPDGRTFVLFGGDTDVPVCGDVPGHTH